jgi:hypothetical protein
VSTTAVMYASEVEPLARGPDRASDRLVFHREVTAVPGNAARPATPVLWRENDTKRAGTDRHRGYHAVCRCVDHRN